MLVGDHAAGLFLPEEQQKQLPASEEGTVLTSPAFA
jgi:hypothetical protein